MNDDNVMLATRHANDGLCDAREVILSASFGFVAQVEEAVNYVKHIFPSAWESLASGDWPELRNESSFDWIREAYGDLADAIERETFYHVFWEDGDLVRRTPENCPICTLYPSDDPETAGLKWLAGYVR